MTKLAKPLLWLLGSLVLCSCVGKGDVYSEVAPSCMQQDPQMGHYLGSDAAALSASYLEPGCRSALESVIPYDEESFKNAPQGFKDKVTEAFQAIIAYPLVVPADSTLLGVSQPPAGAIPLAFFDIYREAPNPNQALFNYILGQIDSVVYGGESGGSADAQYTPAISDKPRRLTVFKSFWSPEDNPFDYFRYPFGRASTLAHEARHGDGIFHTFCDPKTTGASDMECDDELKGAYGFGTIYLKYLLHGSATCTGDGCVPALNKFSIMLTGASMCETIISSINHRFDNLSNLIAAFDCNNEVTYDWIMTHEGIPIPPSQASAPVTIAGTGPSAGQSPNPTAGMFGGVHKLRCHN